MNKYEAACPDCSAFVWVTTEAVGQQVNCPQCDKIFDVPPPSLPASAESERVRLEPDPYLQDVQLDCYETLAAHQVTPDSAMETILRVFVKTDQEYEAHNLLSRMQSRLMVDLFRYPVWLNKDISDGS